MPSPVEIDVQTSVRFHGGTVPNRTAKRKGQADLLPGAAVSDFALPPPPAPPKLPATFPDGLRASAVRPAARRARFFSHVFAADFDPHMSDDLPPPPPPESVPPTREELPTEVRSVKRRYRKADPAETSETADDPDEEIIVLSSLLQDLLERKQERKQSSAKPGIPQGEARARINRFVPRGGNAAPPGMPEAAPTSPEAAAPATPEEKSLSPRSDPSAAEAMASIAFPKYEGRPYTAGPTGWERSGSTWGRGILYFAFAALLALGAFLVGRSDAHHAATPLGRSEVTLMDVWTPNYTDLLDQALAADHTGDLLTARKLAGEAAKTMKPNPVLTAYQATIDTRLGSTNDVEATLSHSLSPTTPPADAVILNEAQGFNYARRREFDRAIDCFNAVVPVRPLDTNNLLHLAEAYRRKGRLDDAVATFRLAIVRLPVNALPDNEARREYLSYKERLTLVEIGRGAEFKVDLAQHLNVAAPAPEWLLTAAAVALQKGDMPAAVDALKKAQAALPAGQFAERMEDYFFRSFAYHPEMNPFLVALTPEQQQARQLGMDFFIDP